MVAPHTYAQHGGHATLGTVVFPNSGSAVAQGPFLRGVALLHSFEYTEAAESFQQAEKIDKAFPLPYYLEAFTNSHLLWNEDDPSAARAALAKLGPTPSVRLAKAKTDRERAYGAAIEAFYAETTLDVRSKAFADSMRHLTVRYSKDLEAAAFASLAIQMADPRGANREEAITLAERVVRESPNHPGAVHYLIHATDAPAYAARGLAAARCVGRGSRFSQPRVAAVHVLAARPLRTRAVSNRHGARGSSCRRRRRWRTSFSSSARR
jgi:tetratricopeptide (TPR) repeat protein